MKKIFSSISIFLFTIIAVVTISCSDFLDVDVQGGVTPESDPALAQRLVTGVYNSLLQGDSWGNGDIHGFAFVSVTNIISDDADKGSTLGDQAVPVGDIDNFTLTPTNKFCESLWSGHYNGIGSANQALKALAQSTIDQEDKNEIIGEVKFLRGYLYFNLVRMFGGVPLVLRVPVDADDANTDLAFKTRAEKSIVYDSIIRDLQIAIDYLPIKTSANGHATRGTAQAMLAKVYMYKASDPLLADVNDWQNAFDLTSAVISSAKYSLVDDYATIWRQAGENNAESIFEIQTGSFNNANLKIDNYTLSQGPRVGGAGGWDDLGWGFNNPSTSLLNSYEPNDERKSATIISIDNSGNHIGTKLWDDVRIPSSDSIQNLYYNYKAYTSRDKEEFENKDDKDRPKNIRILRYAEVLLINAEAAIHTGGGNPDEMVNLVRERAGLSDKSDVTIDDVWQERHIEFAMEHDRFWDIVRQGRAAQVMHAAGKSDFVEGKHELLPIPNSQILLSNNLITQNPSY
jgi:starch-binding outer membrane protein, SusD/RagB family